MNLYAGLLFNQGYIHDPKLAAELAASTPELPESPLTGELQLSSKKAVREKQGNGVYRRRSIAAWCSTALSPFRWPRSGGTPDAPNVRPENPATVGFSR